jgi:putative addiction module component (TIGR02574 family)
MLSTIDIIREAESLPIEERVLLVDSLLRSLNHPDASIDKQWIEVTRRRRVEFQSGQVVGIPMDAVLARLRARFPV